MADIFISYAHEDRDSAERLAHALEGEGWTVWWDPRLRTGVEYRQAIDSELQRTRCVVVLWSAHSVVSSFVCDEAQVGQRRGVLVPVVIEAGVEGPLGFRSLHTAQLVGWTGDRAAPDFRRLATDIGQLLKPAKPARKGRAAAPAPVPVSVTVPASEPGWPRWRVALVAAGAAVAGALIWAGSGETPAPAMAKGTATTPAAAPAITSAATPPTTPAAAPASAATGAPALRGITLGTAVLRPASSASQGIKLASLLLFDKAALDFGPIALRRDVAARPLQLTLRNLGGTPRSFRLAGSGPDATAFTFDALLCPAADGGWRVEKSCQLSVGFTPRHEGPHRARFEVLADGQPTGPTVQLSGDGASPASVVLPGIGNTVTLDSVRCEAGQVTLGGRMRAKAGDYLEVEPRALGAGPSCSAWTGSHQRHAFAATCMRLPADPESSTWTYSAQPLLLRGSETRARAWLRRDVPGQNAVQTVAFVEAPLVCSR